MLLGEQQLCGALTARPSQLIPWAPLPRPHQDPATKGLMPAQQGASGTPWATRTKGLMSVQVLLLNISNNISAQMYRSCPSVFTSESLALRTDPGT